MQFFAPSRFSQLSLVSLLFSATLPLGGCSSSKAVQPGDGKPDAARAADPGGAKAPGYSSAFRATLANPAPATLAEGERLYYEEAYGTEALGEWPPTAFMTSLWKGDVAKWGEQFSKYGFLVDAADDLPVGFKRGSQDPTKVHETCAACHVAKLADGRLWSGMPANSLDWSRFQLDVDAAWVAAGNRHLLSPKQTNKTQLIQQPGSLDSSSSDDPRSIPTDFPLYVDLGVRQNLGYIGAGFDARSQILLSIFTFGAGDSIPAPTADMSDALVAYMSWLTPPKPSTFDAQAAARGQQVFTTAKCGSCHHVDDLSKDGVAEYVTSGPELMPGDDPKHPSGTIATDGAFYALSGGSGGPDGGGPGPGLDKLLSFIVSNQLKVGLTNGYAVTDLHGVFTTAPYLHNGAVASLQDLLTPAAERPKTFVRAGRTVDTSVIGTSNQGHEFGTTLSDTDKVDLIAYLESL